jgi:hypothetical protein
LENHFQNYPIPYKNNEIQHKNTKHNPYQWIVPLNNKNLGDKKKIVENLGFGKWGKWGRVLCFGGMAVVEEVARWWGGVVEMGMVWEMMVFMGCSGCVWEMRERE